MTRISHRNLKLFIAISVPVIALMTMIRFQPPWRRKDNAARRRAGIVGRMRGEIVQARAEKPAVDRYFRGEYQGALDGFLALRGDYSWQIAMCRLRLGKARAGLAAFGKPRNMDAVDYYDLRAALALAAKDEAALKDAVERRARFKAREYSSLRNFDTRPLPMKGAQFARNLMKVALNFGAKYDEETMRFIGEEALRRGAHDFDSMKSYWWTCLSNGDLRRALALAKEAEAEAENAHDRSIAHEAVYDFQNMYSMATKAASAEAEEQRRHREARAFNRRLWTNDTLATSSIGDAERLVDRLMGPPEAGR